MHKRYWLILFLLISYTAFAGLDNHRASARSIALGGTGLMYIDAYSGWNNQGSLGFAKTKSVGAYYEMPASLANIRLVAMGAVIPRKKNSAFALTAYNFGTTGYSETKIGVGYGLKLNDRIGVGAQVDVFQLAFGDNYGSKWAVTTEIGIQAEITKNLFWGAHLYNPNRANVNGLVDEKSPAIYRTGLTYQFGNQSTFNLELEKDSKNEARIKSGLEYHITDLLYLRGGVATNPNIYSFGIGMKAKQLMIDIAASVHPFLGYTPACSITYSFD